MLRRTFAVFITVALGVTALLMLNGTLESPTMVVRANPVQAPEACITVNTDITTNTLWSADCYHVTTNTVAIQPGAILTIIPVTSTRVEFEAGARLSVIGSLQVLGDPVRPVTFTSAVAQAPCAWEGIVVANNPRSLQLQYSTVEYACTGVTSNDADELIIVSNTFRYLGNGGTFYGAIGGDTDNSTIANNTIYSSSNGIILNESSGNSILHNTIYDIDGYGIGFIRQTTTGGNNNTVGDNVIYRTRNGLRLEDGSGNQVLTNSLTLNTEGAIYLDLQGLTTVAYNHVYTNGGGAAYRGGIFITGTGSLPTVRRNVVLDSVSDAVAVDAGAAMNTSQYNALCATATHRYELRNNSATTLNVPNNWWGTNTPLSGDNYLGPVTAGDPIVLSITLGTNRMPAAASATTLVTVTLRDSLNNTVPAPNRSGDPNARRIALQTTLGSVNPLVVNVNDQGIATALLTAVPQVGTGLITATAFCNYPLTATYEITHTNVAIAKTSHVTQTAVGSLVTYTIAYSNPSGIVAPNVVITDVLGPNLAYGGDTSGYPATIVGNIVTWQIGTLPSGAIRSFVLTATVPANAASCLQPINNAAQIGTSALESTMADNTTAAAAISPLCSEWAIIKRAVQPSGPPGAIIEYTLTYSNNSDLPLSGAIITDQLPANTSYLTDTSGLPVIVSGSRLTWTQVSLGPHLSASFLLSVQYTGTLSNVALTNTACISSPLFDRDPGNNCSSAVYLMQSQVDVVVVKDDDVGPSALSASTIGHKSIAYAEIRQLHELDRVTAHRDYVRPGDIVTYTIAVVNVSAYTSTNFILTETLPLYTHLYVTDSWTLVGGRTYTQALGNLYPGTGRVLYFVVQVDPVPAGVSYLINTICGFGSEYDRTPEDNCHIEDTPLFSTTPILTARAFLPLILNQADMSDHRPRVFFSSPTYHVFEGEPTVLITVTLDRPWSEPITVRYATQDGSATAGQDYTATQGILTFAPTQTLRTFNVGIISDTLREYWETVNLSLSEPSPNARLGYPGEATLYIEDVRCVVPTQTLVSLYGPMDVEYDAPTDRLFIANRDGPFGGSLNIAHITPTAYISQSLYGLLSAQGVALDTTHRRLYVVGWDWLNVLDSDTYSLTARITLTVGSEVGAHSVAYNPVNQKIYVTGYKDNSITIIDANTLQIRARLADTAQQTVYEPSYIAVNTNTGKVYVTNHAHGRPIGWVTVISGSTDQIANIIHLDPAGELYGIAADNVHNRLYVASINAAVIYAIDANTDTQLGYLHIRRWSDNQPVPIRMIAVNPNPGLGSKIRLWLTSSSTEDNGLDNIISLTGDWPYMEQPFLGVNLPRSPERGLKFDPTTRAVIVASAASNLVTILWDTPQTQQCLWPFIAPSRVLPDAPFGTPFGPARNEGLYTVVHDFSAK